MLKLVQLGHTSWIISCLRQRFYVEGAILQGEKCCALALLNKVSKEKHQFLSDLSPKPSISMCSICMITKVYKVSGFFYKLCQSKMAYVINRLQKYEGWQRLLLGDWQPAFQPSHQQAPRHPDREPIHRHQVFLVGSPCIKTHGHLCGTLTREVTSKITLTNTVNSGGIVLSMPLLCHSDLSFPVYCHRAMSVYCDCIKIKRIKCWYVCNSPWRCWWCLCWLITFYMLSNALQLEITVMENRYGNLFKQLHHFQRGISREKMQFAIVFA